MSDFDEYQENKGESSEWTSNSDLFMAIAVVFLILFVFSMLVSGVSSVQTAIEKKELNEAALGKVPSDVKKQNEKDMAQLSESMSKMEEQNTIINKSISDLKNLTKEISKRKSAVKRLKEEQLKKAAMLVSSHEKIEQQKKDLANLNKSIKELNEEVSQQKLSNQEAVTKTTKLSKTILAKTEDIDRLKEIRVKNNTEIKQLKTEVSSKTVNIQKLLKQDAKLQKKIESQKQTIASTKTSLASANSEIEKQKTGNSAKTKSIKSHETTIANQQKEINGHVGKNSIMSQKLQLQGNRIGELSDENSQLQGKVKGLSGQTKSLEGKLASSGSEIGKLKGSLEGAGSKIKGLEGALGGANGKIEDLEGKLSANGKELGGLQNQLADANRQISQLEGKIDGHKAQIAKIRETKLKIEGALQTKKKAVVGLQENLRKTQRKLTEVSSARQRIGSAIAKSLRAEGIDVEANPATGIVTIRMDEAFGFSNASYKLKDSAKEKLGKLFPAYAKSLFSNGMADKIAAVSITGYASPRYRRKFVDPQSEDPEAYVYNMELSVNRATQVAEYIFSNETGNFDFKDHLRSITSASGSSYMKPILADSNEETDNVCGKYDCTRSRRVEINFHLRDLNENFNSDLPIAH